MANAGPGALLIIVGEAVSLWAPVLELIRVVDLPVLSQTGVRLAVRPRAAVLGRAEGRTGGLAANRVPSRTLQRQLMRTVGVDVRLTCGGRAVVVLLGLPMKGTRNWVH